MSDIIRMPEPSGDALSDESPHRQSDEVDRRYTERLDQGDSVVGKSVHVIAIVRGRTVTLAAPIDCHTAVLTFRRGDLWMKHPAAEQQGMAKEHCRRVGTFRRRPSVRVGDGG